MHTTPLRFVRLARLAAPLALACASAVAGCGDRSNAAAPDGGDSAILARAKDAGPEGGAAAADSGVSEADLLMPPATSDELPLRMRHLLEAIAQNNPDLANDALFPRDAYIST
ncbi:MAG: hypothetical protein JWO86_2478, partial [Myxococcaceae bacterium]|nr:hypothetical protein [Myxococcaceae bacterium]